MKKSINFLTFFLSTMILVYSGKGYAGAFCKDAMETITANNPQISNLQAKSLLEKLITDLKQGVAIETLALSANQYLPIQTLFVGANLRNQRTFIITADELKKLPDMQYKADLVVVGDIDSEKIEKVKLAIKDSGIRIFPVSFSTATSEMFSLAQETNGSVIQIPSSCNL